MIFFNVDSKAIKLIDDLGDIVLLSSIIEYRVALYWKVRRGPDVGIVQRWSNYIDPKYKRSENVENSPSWNYEG